MPHVSLDLGHTRNRVAVVDGALYVRFGFDAVDSDFSFGGALTFDPNATRGVGLVDDKPALA
jgi:hypothetical protein